MSEAVSQVGHILRNWKNSIYENLELPGGFVAYLLKHQYSEANIGLGKQCLKGADAHLVTNVESIAEELGYNLYLANLEYHLTGFPDQDEAEEVDYQYQKGGSCDENIPGMDRVTKASMTLENIVDLKGSPVIMGYRSLSVSGGNLIPKEPFQNAGPDEKEYEGYMGNGIAVQSSS
ncbi:hypothetical protein H0H93_000804 [Arthromyces matolae]|nr:hypothetical protein H0H93_000804 [Arthromyces matolae]